MPLFGSQFGVQPQAMSAPMPMEAPQPKRKRGLFGGIADYLGGESGTPGINRLATIGATLKDLGGVMDGGDTSNLMTLQQLAYKRQQDAAQQAWQQEERDRQRQQWQIGDQQTAARDAYIKGLPEADQSLAALEPDAYVKSVIEQRKPKEMKIFNTGQAIVGVNPDGTPKVLYQDQKKGGGGNGVEVDENGNLVVGSGVNMNDPLVINRFALASNRITNVLQKNNAFKAVISGAPYLDRIEAARTHPGSVGDQELLDAFTQLNNGGGRVTEAQVNLITHNQSVADWMNKIQNKLQRGGALSDQQRNEILKLSQEVYKNYQRSYKPMYDQAAKQLTAARVPKQFWTIPDPEFLTRNVADGGGVEPAPEAAPQAPARPKNVPADAVFDPATRRWKRP